jgi:hypothetical protein
VKAEECLVDPGFSIRPLSLDRYSGSAAVVSFHTEGDCVVFENLGGGAVMEIIPLAGGDNFWGADYLLAYPLSSGERTLRWKIRAENSN